MLNENAYTLCAGYNGDTELGNFSSLWEKKLN